MRPGHPSMLRLLQLALAAGLLAWLWHAADGTEAVRRLAGADPGWLAAAVVALTLQTVLSALRWRLTAAQLGIVLGRHTAVREYYLSQIVNQALPGGVLGDAGRAVRARAQAGLMASGKAVVFDRLSGQIGLLLVLAAGFTATLAAPGGVDWPGWLLPPVILLLLGALAAPAVFWAAGRLLPGRAGRGLRETGAAFVRAVAAPTVRWRQLGLSLATALCNVAAFGFCAWAVGADIPAAATAALVPLILFAMVLPLTISGWGLREGAAALLFPLAGASAAQGLAASIAFGLVFLASALPGLAFTGGGTAPKPLGS